MQSGSNKKRQEKDKQIGPSWPFTLPTKGVETDRPLRLWTGVCQRYESLRRCVCGAVPIGCGATCARQQARKLEKKGGEYPTNPEADD